MLLTAISSVLHFVENNDAYLKNNLSTLKILEYYLYYAPYIANYLTPITVFIATVFMTSKLASHTEIIAMLSSGMSFMRLMRPYILGGMLIAGVSFLLQGWIIPIANKPRVEFEIAYIDGERMFGQTNFHVKVGPESYVYMQSYSNVISTGFKFSIETIQDNQLIEKVTAERIIWTPDSTGESGTWRLIDWRKRRFDNMHEDFTVGRELDTLINLFPDDFKIIENKQEMLTLPELDEYIALLQSRGADNILPFVLEKYSRFMAPFAAIILTCMGVIVSAKKSRRGSGAQVAIGFGFAALFIIFFLISKNFAEGGSMSPLLAVWLPNIVFTFITVGMYYTVPR
jgi:lipopolysaccharide export system permease protein